MSAAIENATEQGRRIEATLDAVRYEVGLDPAPLLSFLSGFYQFVIPASWLIVRLAVSWGLILRGWTKMMAGPEKFAPGFIQMGFHDPYVLIIISTYMELVGGICIAVGLFTRFWAAALAIELGYITLLYLENGYSWLNRGYEFPLVWGLIVFAIALRGGGPYSVDRLFRREL